jgi:hypothetical protein
MSTGINIDKSIKVVDETTPITDSASQLTFTGAGVTATGSGGNVTINIPGGSTGTVTNVTGVSPIASSGGNSPAISISDAAADGTTKGAATFLANDFNSASGLISLDYANGQKASASQDGFLSQGDYSTFSGKQNALGFTPEDAANKSNDTALGGASPSTTLYPTQNAVKTYADNILGNANALVYKGTIDCSTNPDYPAASAGELYIASSAGKIGGASGVDVEVGDMIICNTDNTAAGNQAAVGTKWNIIEKNIAGAVSGPATSTNNNVAFFDGTTGKLIKDSGITLSGTNTGDQTLSGLGGVPTTRSISINGSSQDLSVDRTFTVTDANLSTSDITTNNVTTSKHGFVPKAPNDTAKFLRGDGTWAVIQDDTPLIFVIAATEGALAGNPVYNNGSNGVGATLTSSTNIVLSDGTSTGRIDTNYIPEKNDLILVKNQADAKQNGIYVITQVGSATAPLEPYILTRSADIDQAEELFPLQVNVFQGLVNGSKYFTQTNALWGSSTPPAIGGPTSNSDINFNITNLTTASLQITFVDNVTTTTLPAYTYQSNTDNPELPGVGATLTANGFGELQVSGMIATSASNTLDRFNTLLVRNETASNSRFNGTYKVVNAGSPTTKWILQRIDNVAAGFNKSLKMVVCSHNSSTFCGTYFTPNWNPTLTNTNIGNTSLLQATNQIFYSSFAPSKLSSILFVSTSGNDTTATKGSLGNTYLTLEAARDAAIAGELIYVFPGTYTVTTTAPNGLAKDGVSYYFSPRTTIQKSSSGAIFNASMTLQLNNGGTGYVNAGNVATTTNGTGTGLTLNITTSGGVITGFSIASAGFGYSINDTITVSGGGGNATLTVIVLNFINGFNVYGEGNFNISGSATGVFHSDLTSVFGSVQTSIISAAGTGYNTTSNPRNTTGGTGTGLQVNITSTGTGGSVTGFTIANAGTNYRVGDVITISGGNNNATLTVVQENPDRDSDISFQANDINCNASANVFSLVRNARTAVRFNRLFCSSGVPIYIDTSEVTINMSSIYVRQNPAITGRSNIAGSQTGVTASNLTVTGGTIFQQMLTSTADTPIILLAANNSATFTVNSIASSRVATSSLDGNIIGNGIYLFNSSCTLNVTSVTSVGSTQGGIVFLNGFAGRVYGPTSIYGGQVQYIGHSTSPLNGEAEIAYRGRFDTGVADIHISGGKVNINTITNQDFSGGIYLSGGITTINGRWTSGENTSDGSITGGAILYINGDFSYGNNSYGSNRLYALRINNGTLFLRGTIRLENILAQFSIPQRLTASPIELLSGKVIVNGGTLISNEPVATPIRLPNGNGAVNTFTATTNGTGYTNAIRTTTTTGLGTGLTVQTANANGTTGTTIVNRGSGYAVGDGITIVGGGNNATFTIASIFTQEVKVYSGGLNTNLVQNGGTLTGKRMKLRVSVTSVASTSISLNDGISSGTVAFAESNTTTYNTTASLAQRMTELINLNAIQITASQDIPGTNAYFYLEADTFNSFTPSLLTNLTMDTAISPASFPITPRVLGPIIEDVDVE